jgi:hypothetical protein
MPTLPLTRLCLYDRWPVGSGGALDHSLENGLTAFGRDHLLCLQCCGCLEGQKLLSMPYFVPAAAPQSPMALSQPIFQQPVAYP